MKKLTFSLIACLAFLIHTYGQLNPVNNLVWQHWYYPSNYFRLSWAPPDSSSDTLVGYNVYRENELFRFQTDNFLNHEEYGIGNVGDTFITYNNMNGFWMHVTAVYNNMLSESGYIDSAHCIGVAIGINKPEEISKLIYPNPAKEKIKLICPEKVQYIEIFNSEGKVLQNFKQAVEIDLRTYPKGVLFFKITTEKNIFFEKVIHE